MLSKSANACRYLGDKVLVPRVVRGDDGEDVPVVLLHDVQHEQSLLLDGGTELEERGLHVLRRKKPGQDRGEQEDI